MSPEYAWNNVQKLEIVSKRAWLIVVIPPNWIIFCGLFPEIHEVLELHFHFITTMSLSHLVLVLVFPVEYVWISCLIVSGTVLKCTEHLLSGWAPLLSGHCCAWAEARYCCSCCSSIRAWSYSSVNSLSILKRPASFATLGGGLDKISSAFDQIPSHRQTEKLFSQEFGNPNPICSTESSPYDFWWNLSPLSSAILIGWNRFFRCAKTLSRLLIIIWHRFNDLLSCFSLQSVEFLLWLPSNTQGMLLEQLEPFVKSFLLNLNVLSSKQWLGRQSLQHAATRFHFVHLCYFSRYISIDPYLPTCLKQKAGENSWKSGTFGLKAGHSYKFDENS